MSCSPESSQTKFLPPKISLFFFPSSDTRIQETGGACRLAAFMVASAMLRPSLSLHASPSLYLFHEGPYFRQTSRKVPSKCKVYALFWGPKKNSGSRELSPSLGPYALTASTTEVPISQEQKNENFNCLLNTYYATISH